MRAPLNFPLYAVIFIGLFSCNNGPKIIEPVSISDQNNNIENTFNPDPATLVTEQSENSISNELHKVKVLEVLPAQRYVYLQVQENDGPFWIATRKMEVSKGEIYFYRGGLLKTNFESKEYNKVFEEIYLVSSLVAEDHSKHTLTANNQASPKVIAPQTTTKEDIPTHTEKNVQHKGTLKIAELVKDPGKYEGHTVQISGTCTKINPNIMERNWIHIKDGSKDDFDLVVTSNTFVPEGSKITIKATVARNRDFGAGYTYDLILENGILLQ